MSLSLRGRNAAQATGPGGGLHNYFKNITSQWRPDFVEGVCQLNLAENDLMKEDMEALFKSIVAKSTQDWLTLSGPVNPSTSDRLLTACAEIFNRFFKPQKRVTEAQLVAGAGCSFLIQVLARVICDPGDVVLTPAPAWSIFSALFACEGVTLSFPGKPMAPSDSEEFLSAKDAIEQLEKLLDWTADTEALWEQHINTLRSQRKAVQAVLLSNPQNPTGRCYSKSFLIGILEFCEKHDLYLIVDEVFALSIHSVLGTSDGDSVNGFQSILSIALGREAKCAPSRVITLWGVAKDFGTSNVRLGVIALPSENLQLKSALLAFAPDYRVSSIADNFYSTFFTMKGKFLADDLKGKNEQNSLSLSPNGHVAESLVEQFMRENQNRLSAAKERLQKWCTEQKLSYMHSDAGHFLMVYFGDRIGRTGEGISEDGWRDETAFYEHLLKHGVEIQSGRTLSCRGPGWFRITFARDQRYMDVGLSRLEAAMKCWPQSTE